MAFFYNDNTLNLSSIHPQLPEFLETANIEHYLLICFLAILVSSLYFLTRNDDNYRKNAEIAGVIMSAAVVTVVGYSIKSSLLGEITCYISIFVVTHAIMLWYGPEELTSQNSEAKYRSKLMYAVILICTVIHFRWTEAGLIQYVIFSLAFFFLLFQFVDEPWKLQLFEFAGALALFLGRININDALWPQNVFTKNYSYEILGLNIFATSVYFCRHFWKPSSLHNDTSTKAENFVLFMQGIVILIRLYGASYHILFEVLCLYSVQVHIQKKEVPIDLARILINLIVFISFFVPNNYQLKYAYFHLLIPITATTLELMGTSNGKDTIHRHNYSIAMAFIIFFLIIPAGLSIYFSTQIPINPSIVFSFIAIALFHVSILEASPICSLLVSLVLIGASWWYPISDENVNSVLFVSSLISLFAAFVQLSPNNDARQSKNHNNSATTSANDNVITSANESSQPSRMNRRN